ncbi:single-stranded DNA-binding protein [Roseateles sp. GG27B]
MKLDYVNGREGKVARGLVTAISNSRRGPAESREEEATAIQWTPWGKQAVNAAEYQGKGSHVNIVGRLRSNNYEQDGAEVYGLAFTCEEIDYLDSKADAEARRSRQLQGQNDGPVNGAANRPTNGLASGQGDGYGDGQGDRTVDSDGDGRPDPDKQDASLTANRKPPATRASRARTVSSSPVSRQSRDLISA